MNQQAYDKIIPYTDSVYGISFQQQTGSMNQLVSKKNGIRYLIVLILFFAVITAVCFLAFRRQSGRIPGQDDRSEKFNHHYAFICGDRQESFYNAVYDSAAAAALQNGDYLEYMGRNLTADYSKYELMEIAIDAKMDGIIIEADESEKMSKLINRADAEGIPVITIGTDNTSAERKSYVGFGYYDLGQNYGKQILRHTQDDPKTVLVLMSPDAEDSRQNIIFQGIRETIDQSDSSRYFDLQTMAVPDTSTFGAEESISGLIMKDGELPDMIVCLNEIYTTCACQALVDYNRVGDTIVYGFYENSTILSSIRKNIISATVTVNTEQMGKYCIEALEEYEDYGYVNEYMAADIEVITPSNVDSYLLGNGEEAADA